MAGETTTLQVVLPTEYPIILLGCVILCAMCYIIAFLVVGRARGRTFTKEFMAQFKEEH